jgi:PII interaction protein X
MANEIYLNHPVFGLLYRVCQVDENQEIFTTLYAQRLFFLVVTTQEGVTFETISRSDARLLVENRLRYLRRSESSQEYKALYKIHQNTFQ